MRGAVTNLSEQQKSRDWVEEQIAAPRREGRDILFGGRVLSWNQVKTIQIWGPSTDVPASSPYQRGRRNAGGHAQPKDVTHEFITGAPGVPHDRQADTRDSLADFSNDELIEELRNRLNRRRSG